MKAGVFIAYLNTWVANVIVTWGNVVNVCLDITRAPVLTVISIRNTLYDVHPSVVAPVSCIEAVVTVPAAVLV